VRNTKLIGGTLSLLARTRTSMEDGVGVAIVQRSVILECFGCVGLVLTTIVHRFVGGAYVCSAFAPEEGG